MIVNKNRGISLVEVLVVTGIIGIVMTMAIQIFYQMRVEQKDSIESFELSDKKLQTKQIFRFLIENAFINGNSTYSFWKGSYSSAGTVQINPLDYPIIYAQEAPLVVGLPSGATANTDILLLQTIQNPQFINTNVTSGISSVTRSLGANSTSIIDNSYLVLASESSLNLLVANGAKTDTDATIDFTNSVAHDFPSGSVLYTNYTFNILYVADSGKVDDNGSPISSLYIQEFRTNNGGEQPQELISGIGNLQISYNINGAWDAVNSAVNVDDAYKRLWYSEIKGIKINYSLDGEPEELIVSFSGVRVS